MSRTIQVLSIASVSRTLVVPDGMKGSDLEIAEQLMGDDNEDLNNDHGSWTIVQVDASAISVGDSPTLVAPGSLPDDMTNMINKMIPQ